MTKSKTFGNKMSDFFNIGSYHNMEKQLQKDMMSILGNDYKTSRWNTENAVKEQGQQYEDTINRLLSELRTNMYNYDIGSDMDTRAPEEIHKQEQELTEMERAAEAYRKAGFNPSALSGQGVGGGGGGGTNTNKEEEERKRRKRKRELQKQAEEQRKQAQAMQMIAMLGMVGGQTLGRLGGASITAKQRSETSTANREQKAETHKDNLQFREKVHNDIESRYKPKDQKNKTNSPEWLEEYLKEIKNLG